MVSPTTVVLQINSVLVDGDLESITAQSIGSLTCPSCLMSSQTLLAEPGQSEHGEPHDSGEGRGGARDLRPARTAGRSALPRCARCGNAHASVGWEGCLGAGARALAFTTTGSGWGRRCGRVGGCGWSDRGSEASHAATPSGVAAVLRWRDKTMRRADSRAGEGRSGSRTCLG